MIAFLTCFSVWSADDISFSTNAPKSVAVGQNFRVTYTINNRSGKDLRAPSFQDGLSVLSGPNMSSSSSTQIINGQVSSSTTVTYTYILSASQEGEFTIPGATITVGKNQYTSNSVKVTVLPADQAAQTQSQGQQGRVSQSSSQPGNISNTDLFMRAIVSKTNVHEQEALLLTFKVYSLVNLRSLSNSMPDLKNFHVQEVELPRQKEAQMEHYNGRNYQTYVWSQYVLFPQQAGDLEIPATSFEAIVSQAYSTGDIFDDFFNNRYIDTKKVLTSDKLTIHVDALPQGKSADFSGAVGDFSISSEISSTDVKANDAVTVKIVVSGIGNMKLIKTPEVKFPQDFDIYDPQVENKYSLKSGGLSGNKVFEYLAIPRHAGDYTIPAVEFQYFDLKSGAYKTLTTEAYQLHVAKGDGNETQVASGYVSKEDLKYVGQDVRFRTTSSKLTSADKTFFGSALYWVLAVIPFLTIVLAILLGKKRSSDKADATRMKRKKASGAATRRLKTARKLMQENRKDEFYDELLRALLGYVGDKLSIPVGQLSKDNIESQLRDHNVSDDQIAQFMRLISDCEFARYAPGDDSGRMDRVYEEAAGVIGQMDNTIRK